jgi:hypothetical protein
LFARLERGGDGVRVGRGEKLFGGVAVRLDRDLFG